MTTPPPTSRTVAPAPSTPIAGEPSLADDKAAAKALRLLRRRIMRLVGTAIGDYGLIRDGDRILVAVSGGKDSLSLLDLLCDLVRRSPVRFSLVAGHIDPGLGTKERLDAYFAKLGIEHRILERPFLRMIADQGIPEAKRCVLCARYRRGALYDLAGQLGCNTVALAHHADDLIETLLMSILFSGQIKAMPARLLSDSGLYQVIRPLCLVRETDLVSYARQAGLPVIANMKCNERTDTKRAWVKRFLAEATQDCPAVKGNALHALTRVVPSHLLAFNRADAGWLSPPPTAGAESAEDDE
jgi:tRNA 2-thiocytidine biosynthesis protein TtcA